MFANQYSPKPKYFKNHTTSVPLYGKQLFMMLQKINLSLIFSLVVLTLTAQKKKNTIMQNPYPTQPKLVVGIVVDQMRYDFLYRYYDKYSLGGFKRLMNEGFNCRNHHYDYAPTVTAAGHAAIFTGSIPAIDGIVGNEWFNQKTGKTVYCVEDTSVSTVGASTKAGLMSPKNLLVSTITDQLKIANNFQSKTIGIALKDRGAILPAGHTANAAYWFDSKDGSWITSSFYMKDLPQWVKDFNAAKMPKKYMLEGWKTLYPIEQYTESTADSQVYEGKLAGEKASVFPHELAAQAGVNLLEVIRTTPFGNTLTKDFALAAIKNENLGKSAKTDFLTVSFSSPDYVGHAFGPNSIEIEDTYLRLDRDIAEILQNLDATLGKDNYLVFLSADHGVADVPSFWQSQRLPAGTFNRVTALAEVKNDLKTAFGDGEFIRAEDNYQLYLNHQLLRDKKLTVAQVHAIIRETLLKREDVADVIDLHNLSTSTLPDYQLKYVKNGLNPRRSGDIMMVLNPSWFMGGKTGTTHGTLYRYDTHVPLLFYGWRVKNGETTLRTNISDISPTVADFLSILEPNGSIGNVIQGVKK
ncbi:MAG: alkaline phosphatase family protein [Arcicella sp.]|jgi:predicted AlkP superfamily pyrophosphatase or phosphodiesterase|nr:alkaline phosphatase family protein [Arcicella sp.]